METGVLIALVGVLATLAGILLQALLGPIVAPWYAERVQRVQHRFQLRVEQRKMITNELEKGFEDLSTVRNLATAIRLPKDRHEQDVKAVDFYSSHEQKWGVWRPYLVEDDELLKLCEEYRTLIRDLRVAVLRLGPDEINEREKQVGVEMSSKALKITNALRTRGW